MNTTIIDKEIYRQYIQNIKDPKIISLYSINGNESIQVRVDTYTSLDGDGFRVVGLLKENNKTYIRVLNYGPDIYSNMEWQELPSTPSTNNLSLSTIND